jgi:hypothetical protein
MNYTTYFRRLLKYLGHKIFIMFLGPIKLFLLYCGFNVVVPSIF